jgi:hypothetical protein
VHRWQWIWGGKWTRDEKMECLGKISFAEARSRVCNGRRDMWNFFEITDINVRTTLAESLGDQQEQQPRCSEKQ